MHQSLLLLVLISLCSLTVVHTAVYHFITDNKTWTKAQNFCRLHYTDLATVGNMTDMNHICLNQTRCTDAWIGLFSQNISECHKWWHWSNPGKVYNKTEANWNASEPNDDGKGNCAYVTLKNGKLVVDNKDCYSQNNNRYSPFICYNETDPEKYILVDDKPMNWSDSLRYCRENHTDMVSGPDQLNNRTLISKIQNNTNDTWWYIGLLRDSWFWSDGNNVSFFRNWANTVKEEFNCWSDYCAKVGDDKYWEIDNCTNKHPFICYDDRMVLIKKNKTWEEALLFCRKEYGDLAMITNQNDQNIVNKKSKMADTDFVWVGLYFVGFFQEWVWVNGQWDSSSTYKNWKSGENHNDCGFSGAVAKEADHEWVKKPSQERYNFVCSIH